MTMILLSVLFLFVFALWISATKQRISRIELYRQAEKAGQLRIKKEDENASLIRM